MKPSSAVEQSLDQVSGIPGGERMCPRLLVPLDHFQHLRARLHCLGADVAGRANARQMDDVGSLGGARVRGGIQTVPRSAGTCSTSDSTK
jgi:hypothetical protein